MTPALSPAGGQEQQVGAVLGSCVCLHLSLLTSLVAGCPSTHSTTQPTRGLGTRDCAAVYMHKEGPLG